MSDEDAISLSDAESEGEGPNIRPPQAAGSSHSHGGKKHHKQKYRDRDMWRQRHRDERDGGKRDRDGRRKGDGRRDDRRDRDRERVSGGGRRISDNTQDLRHRLKEKHSRDSGHEDRPRSDKRYSHESRSRSDRDHHSSQKANRFVEADKHKEKSRREVEEARRQRELLEKEMEIIADKLKRKNKARSRSTSRGKRGRQSESGEESGEESENEEVSDEEEEGSDERDSDTSGTDATGSQKSEDTPNREESEEGELEDDEDDAVEEVYAAAGKKSRSRSRTPVEGRWADRSPSAERTPSRSPTPMKDEDEMEVDPKDEEVEDKPSPRDPFSKSESPATMNPLLQPPAAAPEPLSTISSLPPYLPSVHGCRSVSEFACKNRIEEGTYGVVYRAEDKKTKEIVALKKLKMEKEKEGFPITSLREINTLLISQHVNVVTVREIVVGSNMDQIYIVMDFVEHDLKSLMETMRKKNQVFLPGEVKCLMIQLLRAIHHLHDNWILHRDLKSSNLLLGHNGILKVGDFGLAREYGSPLKAYTSIVVTLWYRAPELLLGLKNYSTHIDVWSIGCIFGELLQMEPLFPGKSETDELNKIFKLLGTPSEKNWSGFNNLPGAKVKFVDYPVSSLRNKFPEKILSETGLDLLKDLLTYDPKKRITCEEALNSTYFTEKPVPIDPSMFPTWPAKSEQDPQDKLKKATSPKAPSGGHAFKKMHGDDDEERAMRSRGFNLLDGLKNQAPSAGWNLRF